MAWVEELEASVKGIAESVGKSVVAVGGGRGSRGSGFVIEEGKVVTNAHNLWEGQSIDVTFGDGRTEKAEVAAADVDGDLAVLTVKTNGSPALSIGTSTPTGTPVFALSNPSGRGLRVTFGLVSAQEQAFHGPRGRKIAGALEHTAPLLPGSSGGPLVNAAGEVVGINTHRLGEGFYLSIPANDQLKEKLAKLSKGETPKRPHLGVALAPPRVGKALRRAVGLPPAEGLLVREVEEGSPAEDAGLKEGDLLIKANGSDLSDIESLFDVLEPAGKTLSLTILRGTEELTVEVPLPN